MLAELTDQGLIEKRGKRMTLGGQLPAVAVLEIFGRDHDGGLVARPQNWDSEEHGDPPHLPLRQAGNRSGAIVGVGDRVLANISGGPDNYRAMVMKKLPAAQTRTIGIVKDFSDGHRMIPVDRRAREVEIASDHVGGAKDGDLVEVDIRRTGRAGLSEGRVTQVLGNPGSEQAISMIALHVHDIPHVFPEAALGEAEKAKPLAARERTADGREDWRQVSLITIDPQDARDHDDAIFAEADPEVEGGWYVVVAIADVAFYVRPGSALDREAQKRGNSVYFPGRVVPMLPERISNQLCSLVDKEDRPALAVRMRFTADGQMTWHRFSRITMRSHAKLSYRQAQAAIDGAGGMVEPEILETVLEPLWAAYRCLTKGRNQRGPLELDLPERKVVLDDDGRVARVIVPPRLDAHRLVEEFMIQANVAAATSLERKKQSLIYRCHDAPSLDKLESLRQFLKGIGIPLAKTGNLKPSEFNRILDQVRGADVAELAGMVVLRSQSQAEYSERNYGHFGLNLARYAHFTSPIRRYADLIVHRALITALGLGKYGQAGSDPQQLTTIAEHISKTERRAMAAERDTLDRLIADHLAERTGETFDGRINGVTAAGLFVTLNETGADGFIPVATLGDDYFHFDEAARAFIAARDGQVYQLGDPVSVKLVEALPVSGSLRFEMISDGKKAAHLVASRHKRSRSRPNKGPTRGKPQRRRRAGGKR